MDQSELLLVNQVRPLKFVNLCVNGMFVLYLCISNLNGADLDLTAFVMISVSMSSHVVSLVNLWSQTIIDNTSYALAA